MTQRLFRGRFRVPRATPEAARCKVHGGWCTGRQRTLFESEHRVGEIVASGSQPPAAHRRAAKGLATRSGRVPVHSCAISQCTSTRLHTKVTFVVGDNGTGKSTLIEGMAVAAGFNAEGGNRNYQFSSRSTESDLHTFMEMGWGAQTPAGLVPAS